MSAAACVLPSDAVVFKLVREIGAHDGLRLLTIVIGSYNHRRYLNEAFAAIEACRSLDRLALIFIDDGSSDGSLAFATEYPFDPRLHVRVIGKSNSGLRDSLAGGLALTATPFVCFIASDDHYEPAGLDAAITKLSESSSFELCWICQATYLEGRNGEAVYGPKTVDLIAAEPGERLRRLSVAFPKPLLLQSTLFGTDMLRKAGAWSDRIVLDDWPTFLRVARLATETSVDIAFIADIVLCRYRLHLGGAHNNTSRQLNLCLEVAENLVAPVYLRESKARIYLDVGMIHLAERRFRQAVSLFARGLRTKPTPDLLVFVPCAILNSIFKRIVFSLQNNKEA